MVEPATAVRTTLLSASTVALRKRGLIEEYLAVLPKEHHDLVLGLVAGDWLPIEVGVAHYAACDSLRLSANAQYDMGYEVGQKIQQNVLGTLVRLAQKGGVTPWDALPQLPRLWQRMIQGGATAVYQTGPKDARVEFLATPFARYAYCRNAFRGILAGVAESLCRKVYVTEINELRTQTRFAAAMSWA